MSVLAVHTATSECDAVWTCSVLHGPVNAILSPALTHFDWLYQLACTLS